MRSVTIAFNPGKLLILAASISPFDVGILL